MEKMSNNKGDCGKKKNTITYIQVDTQRLKRGLCWEKNNKMLYIMHKKHGHNLIKMHIVFENKIYYHTSMQLLVKNIVTCM